MFNTAHVYLRIYEYTNNILEMAKGKDTRRKRGSMLNRKRNRKETVRTRIKTLRNSVNGLNELCTLEFVTFTSLFYLMTQLCVISRVIVTGSFYVINVRFSFYVCFYYYGKKVRFLRFIKKLFLRNYYCKDKCYEYYLFILFLRLSSLMKYIPIFLQWKFHESDLDHF